jgi:hypothetical protein
LRILFDKNVPVGVRGFLAKHEVVRWHNATIAATIDAAVRASYHVIEMPLPPKPRNRRS